MNPKKVKTIQIPSNWPGLLLTSGNVEEQVSGKPWASKSQFLYRNCCTLMEVGILFSTEKVWMVCVSPKK